MPKQDTAQNPSDKTPLLSVVIPAFRAERYLPATMQSLFAQKLTDMEIILVDDCSPDETPAMCDKYAAENPNIRVIHKAANEGLGYARNTGLESARGKYITFLDSDDTIHPDTYSAAVECMEKTGADTVRFTFNRFTDDGDSSPERYPDIQQIFDTPEDIRRLSLGIFDTPDAEMAQYALGGSSCMAVYRLDLIREHALRFESEREYISEDYLFNFDYYALCQKVVWFPRTYYHYRINPASVSRNPKLDVMDRVASYCSHIAKRLREKGYSTDDELYATGYYINTLRAYIRFVFMSPNLTKSEKKQWFMERTSDPIFRQECAIYPWRKLPPKQKLFFWAIWHKKFHMTWLLIMATSKKLK